MHDIVVIFGIRFSGLNQDDVEFLEDYDLPEDIDIILPYSISACEIGTAAVGFVIQGFENFNPTPLDYKKINWVMYNEAENYTRFLHMFLSLLPETLTAKAGEPDLLLFMSNDD